MTSQDNPFTLSLRLRIFKGELVFGPGIAELMENIQKTGSLSAACKQMGMAYSKGWKIIRRAEDALNYPLIEGVRGGPGGGNTSLTAKGADFLARYREMESALCSDADKLFACYFPESKENNP